MGNYEAYSLVLNPGERDPEVVAAEFNESFPDVLATTLGDRVDINEVIYDGKQCYLRL